MAIGNDRLIGSAGILPVITKLYGVGSWRGALYLIKREGIPMYRTADEPTKGKPLIYIKDLVEHELKKGRKILIDGAIIQ